MLVCVSSHNLCTRDRGCSAHPAFPAPSVSLGRKFSLTTRALRAAGMRRCVWLSLRAQRSNPPRRAESMDCFAALAMTWIGRAIQYSRDFHDRTEKPRLTGRPAFAEHDKDEMTSPDLPAELKDRARRETGRPVAQHRGRPRGFDVANLPRRWRLRRDQIRDRCAGLRAGADARDVCGRCRQPERALRNQAGFCAGQPA